MTLIAGYVYKGTVQIIADSAESVGKQTNDLPINPSPITSFGEIAQNEDYRITESAQKIYNIENKIILTFAGNVQEGESVVKDIRSLYCTFGSIADFFNSYFSQNIFLETQYIIGYYEDNIAKLFYCYENGNFAFKEGEKALALGGTNANNISQSVISSYNWVFEENAFSPDDALIYILATIQWYSITFLTLNNHVGGFINGCYISEENITWAKDTMYLMYSIANYEKGEKYTTIKFNRENTVFVISNYLRKMFMVEQSEEVYRELMNNYGEELEQLINTLTVDYYVLMSYDHHTITVVNRSGRYNDSIIVQNGQIRIGNPVVTWMFNYDRNAGFLSSTNFVD